MYIYEFLKALQIYPIDRTKYPQNAFYLGIYTIDDIIQKDIDHIDNHHYYLVYSLKPNEKLHSIAIDEEMNMIHQYDSYTLILSRKTSIFLDEAIIEAMRLYDEFVYHKHYQWSTDIFASMFNNGDIHQQPTLSYFDYNPLIYQLAYARFVYFIKVYCFYRLKTDTQGYPIKNFEERIRKNINMYIQKEHHTYHIYQLTNYENKEFDLFLSQISKI